MAKSLIAALLLAAALIGAVVVPASITRGTFAFDAWPQAPQSRARDEQVVIAEPASERAERSATRPRHAGSGGTPALSGGASKAIPNELASVPPPKRDTRPAPSAGHGESQPDKAGESDAPAPPAPAVPDTGTVADNGSATAGGSGADVEARPVAVPAPQVAATPDVDTEETPAEDPPDEGDTPPKDRGRGHQPDWLHLAHSGSDRDDDRDERSDDSE